MMATRPTLRTVNNRVSTADQLQTDLEAQYTHTSWRVSELLVFRRGVALHENWGVEILKNPVCGGLIPDGPSIKHVILALFGTCLPTTNDNNNN